ncbi:MAG: hypothetical protein ABMA64_36610 [Myxococcota bacterium]
MRGWMLLIAGCSDYGLTNKPEPATPPPDTGTPIVTTPAPDPTCADVPLPVFEWVGSEPFTGVDDPIDASGLPFWDPASDRSAFTFVVIPDLGIPVGFDRVYATSFELPELPVDLSLNLQSDDGITVWVNGVELGTWGGDWQMEGCVNEHANCLVTSTVEPVSITSRLVAGTNVIAARVSNPVLNAYFEILPECVE